MKAREAARQGDVRKLRALLAEEPALVTTRGAMPMHEAAKAGHAEVVRALLDSGVDVDTKGEPAGPFPGGRVSPAEFGGTALHQAALTGQVAVLLLVLERGADVNARDGRNYTPLTLACLEDNEAVADLLRRHGGVE